MVLLIAPDAAHAVYQNLTEFAAREPPIWMGLLHQALTTRGYDAVMIDQGASEKSHESILDDIKNLKPKLIAIICYGQQPSASTQTMHAVNELIDVICESRIPIILVGGHPSALPIQTLEKEKCTYVAKGEGLNVICDLLDKKEVDNIPGLYTKHGNDFFIPSKEDKKAERLDIAFPGIDWAKLPMHRYRAHTWHVLANPDSIDSYASIYTSLGCPFKCSFCCINAPFGGSSFRYWSPQFTVEEISTLYHKFGIQNLKIADEMFVLKEDHFLNICNLLIEYDIKMNIWAYARIDTIKPKYLNTLKRAGVNWLALGIESGSQHVRDGVTKGRFKMEDIYNNVKLIQSHGIHVIGNYIFGLPDDTEESMRETYEMACELNCEFANFYSAMAYPGSALYHQTKKEDLPDSYLGFSQHSFETKPLRTETCDAATVLKARDDAHKNYFERETYLNLVKKKFGQKGLELIKKMNKKTLPRQLMGHTRQSESPLIQN